MLKPNSIINILIIGISAALVWFFVVPSIQQAFALRDKLAAENEDLAILVATKETIDAEVKFYSELSEEDKNFMSQAAPPYPDKHNLFILINRFAIENGLILTDIEIKDSVKGAVSAQALAVMPVKFTLEGGYVSFKEFLKVLENSLRILDIDSINIKLGKEFLEVPANSLTFILEGKAYYSR